jgi:hypothetical protein
MELQHRFRGLISDYKSRKFVEKRDVTKSKQFKSGLSELFLDMRSGLTSDQYRSMLEWVAEQKSGQLLSLQHPSDLYEELAGIYMRAHPVSLQDEIRWITERLRIERARLSAFCFAASAIQQLTFRGDYEHAIEAMVLLQELFGVSLWSVQTRLALEHLAGGLERQKKYSAEVRSIYRQGLLGFVTYHTSVRNEDRTTFTKFLEDIEQRIDRHPYYDDAVKGYARYRLKDEYPVSDSELASILRVEQSHSIFDIYQTFVAVLQAIVSRGCDDELKTVILAGLRDLDIDDFRIIKILKKIEPTSTSDLPVRDRSLSNSLLDGNAVKAALAARRFARTSTDPWLAIYAGFAHSHARRERALAQPRPTTIAQSIGRIQSRYTGANDAWHQLAKLALNLRGLPLAAGILDFLRQMRRAHPTETWHPDTISLNSPTIGIEDYQEAPLSVTQADKTTQIWLGWFSPQVDAVDDEAHSFANAMGMLRQGHFDEAIESLLATRLRWHEPLRALRALALLHCHHARGDRQKIIELIANEGSRGESFSSFVPILSALKGLDWPSYKQASPIAAAIALHLLWSQDENVQTVSTLRFATGNFLRGTTSRLPSRLAEQCDDYDRHELVYFLRRVCVPHILDLSRVVQGTRKIMDERQAICAALRQLDLLNSDDYEQEIFLISNQLALDEGRRIVDSTRIHVDTAALIQWAKRELSEDYGRYRDLVGVEVGSDQTFEDVLRELMDGNPAQRSVFKPNSEADAILISVLKRLGGEFLSNPIFGLDFNLSKRVRHQSFIGLIRGPLEVSQLITTRESEVGEYHRNEYWVAKFTGLGAARQGEVDIALRTFSARFDETLTEAKDKYFHIRSDEKPDGMIVLTLNDRMISVARAIISLDLTIEEFLTTVTNLLWGALEPSLAQVRTFIGESIKRELIEGFDALRSQVRLHAENDPSFLEFDSSVGSASNDVQIKLDEAAIWFNHPQKGAERALFTLNQALKVAIDTAAKSHRGFNPTVSQSVEGDVHLRAGDLVFVHDVVFVAMGNAHKHSGAKTPQIDVKAVCDAKASTLTIEVVSDSRPSNREANEKSMVAIRKLIKSGKLGPRTRTEGGSGFLKLAAVVGQSERGDVTFGYAEDGRFRLKVTYALIIIQEPITDAQ